MPLALAAWLALCLIWGSTWAFIKLGLRDLPPLSFAAFRVLAASVALWGIVAARRAPLPKSARTWAYLAFTGFLAFSVNYGLLFWGEERTSSGLAAVLQATIPAFGLVMAHLILRCAAEPPSWRARSPSRSRTSS
jgi:drug/metabolite transporter (DMT)-like permease